jgi:hypothetical protein
MKLSDATYQEELLRSIRNPNPPGTEKIDPQHELGIVQADFGHIDFRIADNLAVDLQSEEAMSVCAQLLSVGTTHGHCRIARQDRFWNWFKTSSWEILIVTHLRSACRQRSQIAALRP